MDKFKFNDCGVCTNPDIVLHEAGPTGLAWEYIEIQICEFEGSWFSGWNLGGGGSPCSRNVNPFISREEAISATIKLLKGKIKKRLEEAAFSTYKSKDMYEAYKRAIERYEHRQLQLF